VSSASGFLKEMRELSSIPQKKLRSSITLKISFFLWCFYMKHIVRADMPTLGSMSACVRPDLDLAADGTCDLPKSKKSTAYMLKVRLAWYVLMAWIDKTGWASQAELIGYRSLGCMSL